jgi:hypothetical protein
METLMLNLIRARGDGEKTRAHAALKRYCAEHPQDVKKFARTEVSPGDYAKAMEMGVETGKFLLDVISTIRGAIKGKRTPPA